MKSLNHRRKLVGLISVLTFVNPPLVIGSSAGASIHALRLTDQNVLRLSRDSHQEREIAEGESHIYALTLSAGDFLRVSIEGAGADLNLDLNNEQGTTLRQVSVVIGFRPVKRLSFLCPKSGEYRLILSGTRKGPSRRYQLRIADWRPSEAKDESAVAGERAYGEAVRLESQNSAEATLRAIDKYEEATKQWRVAGDRPCEAFTLMKTGLALHNLTRLQDAIDHYNVALKIFEELHDELGISHTLTSIGWSYSGLGRFKESLNYCQRALEIRRRQGDPRAIAQTLNLVAAAHQELGDERQAIASYLEAIPLAKAAQDPSIEAYALNGLAWLYNQAGEFEKAIESVDQALPLWRSVGNIRGEAQSLHLRGTSYSDRLYASESLESFEQAIAIWRKVGNKFGEASVLNNMGVLYQFLGEYQRARDLFVQALDIWKVVGNRGQQARTLGNLGLIEWRLDRLQQSLEFFEQSLAISVADGQLPQQAVPLLNIGNVRILVGDRKRGLEDMRRSLRISRETGQKDVEHDVLNDLGVSLLELGDEQGAMDCFRQATLSTPARVNRAQLEAKQGNLSVARTLIEDAISRNETKRRHIPGQDMRVSYGDIVRKGYVLRCDIIMQQYQESVQKGRPNKLLLGEALEASEAAQARGLLEGLAESRADIRRGADAALIAEERSLQERLNARETHRSQLLNAGGPEARLSAVNKEIQELEWQLGDVKGRIRSRDPEYSALIEPRPPSLADLRKVLDGNTIFLEYLLGKERSFLWLLTSDSIDGYVLPDKAKIESKAREFHETLSATSHEQSNGSFSKTQASYREIGAELARMLLGPISSQLAKKRIVIVADGALQYIPFGALPDVSANHRTAGVVGSSRIDRPLIVDHEIINAPSGAVLAALRNDTTDRKRPDKELAVFADAVFSKDDSRLKPAQSAETLTPSQSPLASNSVRDVEKIAVDAGLPSFVRLRFSRHEANVIASLVPATEKLEALDFEASKAAAQSADLGNYRILHFATHGLLNSLHPDLSGLVFSLVDRQGRPQDGFLRSYEIYNLKLNADLVVLSGCQTALGKYAKSEGLIGLTRGFMYAGAPRIVASLWRVDDRATAELMKRFYRSMLQEKLSPAAALRAAQVAMLSEPRWESAHYWAAFTIQGEWR